MQEKPAEQENFVQEPVEAIASDTPADPMAEPVPEHLAPAAEYVAREAAADPVAAAPVARPHEVDIPLRPRFPQPLSEAGSAVGAYAGALPSIEMVDDVEQVPVSFEIDPNAEAWQISAELEAAAPEHVVAEAAEAQAVAEAVQMAAEAARLAAPSVSSA